MSNGDGLIRSLVDGDLEGFRQRFESFLDQCPSFLYYVGEGRFLPVFFFSMFATAHDAGILGTDERVYFCFDNHGIDTNGDNRDTGNLKVAILTNKFHGKQRIVRCYSISDSYNSPGARFSERERNSIEREIVEQDQSLEGNLHFEQYKIRMHGKSKSQGEKGAAVFDAIREDKFGKYSASEVNLVRQLLHDHGLKVKEIEKMHLTQNQNTRLDRLVNFVQVAPGQQRIDGFMEMLASNQRQNIKRRIDEEILPYITDIYHNYRQALENNIQNRNQKFESYALLLGFLANFSHLYTIDIDFNLSPENSYAAFLVRRQAERENVPIVINLVTGRTWSRTALSRAIGHAERLHASSFIPVHTESGHAVCVGLNLNLNRVPFSVNTVRLQQDRFPLVQRLFECVENEEIRRNIRDFLLHHLPNEIQRGAGNYDRIFDCITGFAFGSSAFDHEQVLIQNNGLQVAKHIFRYDDGDHALTMVFHAQGSDIVILHIRAHDAQQQGDIDLQTLNVNGDNVHVWEVSCTLSNQLELDIDLPNDLGLYHDYQNNNANNFLDGDLVQVPNAKNVHNTLNQVMNDGWQDRVQHQELFRNISAVLTSEDTNSGMIIDVNSKDKFRSMLHGIFYACDNTEKVITRYRVGQEQKFIMITGEQPAHRIRRETTELKLDLLLLRSIRGHPDDTHPIGYTLKFAGNQGEVQQEQNRAELEIKSLMGRQRGYLPITSGNEVVLSSAVFNAGAQRVENLISIPQGLYIHRLDRSHAAGPGGRPGRIVRPALNSILPLINTYIQNNPNGAFGQLRDVHDILTLDFATDNCNYHYWLQDEDIRYAARAQRYNLPHDEGNILFNVIREQDIHDQLQGYINYRGVQVGEILISNLIVNTGRSHWVTLVIVHQNGNYYGYYANSLGGNVPDQLNTLRINNVPVPAHNVLADQEGNLLV